MKKIIRISTVPISLNVFCRGLLCDLSHDYEIVAVSSPGEDLDELAARENVRAIAVPMRLHPSTIYGRCGNYSGSFDENSQIWCTASLPKLVCWQ